MIMKSKTELIEDIKDLTIKKIKLDRFFTKFLDKYDRKMDPCNTNTPIWKLYHEKHKEYEDVSQKLRVTEYYMKQVTNV